MRRYARNRWERATQVLRWLQHEFDLPDNIWIEFAPDIDNGLTFGELVERNGQYVIRLSRRTCRTTHDAVYNVMHEAAHLRLQRDGLGDLHGPVFWRAFGAMVDAYDHHGHLDSKSFSVD